MKKAIKRIAAVVAAALLTVCATVAMPTEAKAETTKTLYLKGEAGVEYSIGLWSPFEGITFNADLADDGWTYKFTATEEEGVYKLEVVVDGFTGDGLSICVNGTETYKADTQWTEAAGKAAWEGFAAALTGDATDVHFKVTGTTIEMLDESGEEVPTTTKAPIIIGGGDDVEEEQEEEPDNMLPIVIAVVAVVLVVVVVAVVVLGKKKTNK